ncbi:hypothetical protein BH23ACT11_BH23ACT11_06140 [soil metagenome]
MRILVAFDPRAYREAILQVMTDVYPYHEVFALEPEQLTATVHRLQPDIVYCGCSEPEEPVDAWTPLTWVDYRPYEGPTANLRPRRSGQPPYHY